MYIILLLIFLIIGLILYYIINSFKKILFIKKINNKLLRLFICFVPIIVLFLLFGFINGIIILLHLAFFLKLIEITFKIIVKIKNIKLNYSFIILSSFLLTTIYLGIGVYLNYHVVTTYYELETVKNIGSDNFRIIHISDAHMGTTFDGDGFRKQLEKIKDIDSDIVVITGDFVDDDTKKDDMITSIKALSILKPKYGIYYVYGNHDKGYGNNRDFNYTDMENEFVKYNIKVLEDEVVLINDSIYLVGRKDKSSERKSIEELVNYLDKDKYIIDLNHQPNDYQNEMNNVDLVLSGHTHGGQLFPLGPVGILIGANDEYYGLHQRENTYFIVNSGISDWAIDFKTGTFSEIGIINIKRM